MLKRGQLLWAIVALLAVLAPPAVAARPFQPGAMGFAHRPVCKAVPKRVAHCNAEVVIDASGAPLVTFTPSGYGPGDLQSAYGLTSRAASAAATQTSRSSTPTTTRTPRPTSPSTARTYGLPACTTANGCFRKVNQNGGTLATRQPTPAGPRRSRSTSTWSRRSARTATSCSSRPRSASIARPRQPRSTTAATLGATYDLQQLRRLRVSAARPQLRHPHYNHPGIAVTVSSGDSGYGVEYPAASRYVTAVGGTTLQPRRHRARLDRDRLVGRRAAAAPRTSAKPSWQTDTGLRAPHGRRRLRRRRPEHRRRGLRQPGLPGQQRLDGLRRHERRRRRSSRRRTR